MSGTVRSRRPVRRSHRNLDVVGCGGPGSVQSLKRCGHAQPMNSPAETVRCSLRGQVLLVYEHGGAGRGTGVVQCRSYLGLITPISS